MKETILQNQRFIDDIIHVENENGELCKNTFEIGLQAIIGKSVLVEYEERNRIGLIPRIFDIELLNHKPDKYAKKAIEYLENSYKEINNAYTWLNDYEVYFRGKKILEKNWPCSFGQSYILMAFIFWYKITGNKKYLNFAIKAAKYYLIELKDSGFKNTINIRGQKYIFFEELPSSNPTHILNAHMISLIALHNLLSVYKENWLEDLINQAKKTLECILPLYDIGNWSRYDLPDEIETVFQIGIEDAKSVFLKDINFKLSNQSIILDNNTDFDNNKILYLSGIDWGMLENIDNMHVRKVLNGKLLRKKAVNGGTIQNSYINIRLKNIKQLLLNNEMIDITMNVYSKENGKMYFNLRDCATDNFEFINVINYDISVGWNKINFSIPLKNISNVLSNIYHTFHVELLNILSNKFNSNIFNIYFKKFLSYKQKYEFKNSYLPYIEKFTPEKMLEVAFISINSVCGLNCIMCDIGIKDTSSSLYKHLKSDEKYNMTLEDFDIITNKLKNKVKTIAFIGTEPLLNKKIYDFIKIAKEKGFYVTLTTNGINLYNNVKKLVVSKLDEIWLSIDGLKNQHDKIRRKNGLFEKIELSLKDFSVLKKEENINNPKIFISFTILPSVNETSMLEFLKYFEKYEIDGFSFNHINFVTKDIAIKHNKIFKNLPIVYSKYLENFNFHSVDYLSFYNEIHKVKTYANKYQIPVSFVPDLKTFQSIVDYYLHPEIKVGKKTCTAPWSTLEIDPKGNMSIAARCFQINMGNIINDEFYEIWMGEKYQHFRKMLLENESFLPCNRCCGAL